MMDELIETKMTSEQMRKAYGFPYATEDAAKSLCNAAIAHACNLNQVVPFEQLEGLAKNIRDALLHDLRYAPFMTLSDMERITDRLSGVSLRSIVNGYLKKPTEEECKTAKLYVFDGKTTLDIGPDKVLDSAIGKLSKVVVLGFENDEKGELYMAASCGNIPEALYLLEKCKQQLLSYGED